MRPEVRSLCAKEIGDVCTQATKKPLTRTFLGIASVWEASYEVNSVNTFNNHVPGAAYPYISGLLALVQDSY